MSNERFRTPNIELAAYLHATQALKLAGTEHDGRVVQFIFDASVERGQTIAAEFHKDATVGVRSLFTSFRFMRNMVHQQREITKTFQGASNEIRNNNQSAR